MKADFSLYEVRIFMKIVELANQVIKGQKISPLLGKAICMDGVNCNLTIPVRELMTEGSNAYNRVREALRKLMKHEIEMKVPNSQEWRATTILNNIRWTDHDGLIKFVVPKWLMEYILNFVNERFSEYNLQNALALPSGYAVRLYWIACSLPEVEDYRIEFLRAVLGCNDKYPHTKDFIRRVIEPAQKILAERNLNGFTFEKVKKGKKIIALRLRPVQRQQRSAAQLMAMGSTKSWCNPLLRQYLTTQCNFSMKDLGSIKQVLFDFGRISNWQSEIVRITNRARRNRKNKGYIVNGMKIAIEENTRNQPFQNKKGQI